MPEISVIVPIYKVEPYLRRCVDSILAQTFADFEVILVDDGSPDGCPAICDEYAGKDERVRVIHQENGGLSAARNAGLDWVFANSDSRWISFVDSDDWVHPRFLEYLHRAAVENNVQISICDYIKITDYEIRELQFSKNDTIVDAMELHATQYSICVVAWNKLYRKELFKKYRYPVGKLHEDAFLSYRLLYDAGKIVYVHSELYYYFQNESGIMKSKYSLARLAEVEAAEEQCAFFKQIKDWKNYDSSIKRLMNFYTMHIQSLAQIDGTAQIKQLRRKLRRLIKKYNISIRTQTWYYEAAYPILANTYWKWIYIQNIYKSAGVKGCLKKVLKKVFTV